MKTILYSLLLTIFTYYSCTKEKILCSPKPPYAIEIIDKDSNDIVGNNKRYNPDSIYYQVNNTRIKASVQDSFIHFITGFNTLNDKEFYLMLESSDSDTLNLKINNGTSECGTYTEILEFKYNRIIIKETKRVFKVVK